ncbi:hypothetical protein [Methanosarcina lacustris]|uniref:hypothetical protein n=1 Tax=Methanosarcina lacustris TaxID=170861 RepID=UPI000B1573C9|nr:hypothetical protein [Methanosarcina lacustris]
MIALPAVNHQATKNGFSTEVIIPADTVLENGFNAEVIILEDTIITEYSNLVSHQQ